MEDKKIPLIPDDELYLIEHINNYGVDKKSAIDYNFRVLKEKINQVVEVVNMTPEDVNKALQEELSKKEEELDIYKEKVRKANRFIKENTVEFGKYKVMIQENDELLKILAEVVFI